MKTRIYNWLIKRVTRLEVVSNEGIQCVSRSKKIKVSLQDDERTTKIFIK